ncbi:DUF3383 domain-containing protein [Lysinibacillus piscis]|uniref:DUF3383 family protein n=1 Tax=Lysinibacillus piscis TaxID=2518931 RepID=A0ABQ5NIQ7_9BACI|nr:DUF3383 domain-containing protein [Lysinibacillus sp. KH24]GLC88256.1 hypothetical protein LYSBPC_13830 [Lysinibacillus sp. KH24]
MAASDKSRFVEVNITRETKPVSEKGFGLPLMLATSKELDYKVYTDISEVAEDFAETTKEYKLATRMFGQSPKIRELACYGVSYISGTDDVTVLTGALNNLVTTHNDWFYLVSTANGDEEIKTLCQWMSTQEKIYAVTTPNIALTEELKNLYENVLLSVHDDEHAYHAEGLIAYGAPQVIGSYVFSHKQVNGVRAAKLSNAEINTIIANNATTCINEMGWLINASGKAVGGEYLDVIQADYFLRARLREDVFQLLATVKKIPYTDAGIAQVVACMDTRFKSAYRQGIIAEDDNGEPDYTITFPRRKDIPKNTIAQRILPDINFRIIIAGGVEKVQINGVLAL